MDSAHRLDGRRRFGRRCGVFPVRRALAPGSRAGLSLSRQPPRRAHCAALGHS